jgi:hypothetical protein
VSTFEFIERFIFGFSTRLAAILVAVLLAILWRRKMRGREPRLSLVLIVWIACCVAIYLLTLILLFGRLTPPPDFWTPNFWTKPQPGGLEGFIAGAVIAIAVNWCILFGEAMHRASNTKSFWGPISIQFGLTMLSIFVLFVSMSGGIIIGSLIALGLRPAYSP